MEDGNFNNFFFKKNKRIFFEKFKRIICFEKIKELFFS
jgi:hypothetical protein